MQKDTHYSLYPSRGKAQKAFDEITEQLGKKSEVTVNVELDATECKEMIKTLKSYIDKALSLVPVSTNSSKGNYEANEKLPSLNERLAATYTKEAFLEYEAELTQKVKQELIDQVLGIVVDAYSSMDALNSLGDVLKAASAFEKIRGQIEKLR